MAKQNRNLSYPEFQALNWTPKKDEYGGTIGARSFDEWKAKENLPADGADVTINLGHNEATSAAADGNMKNLFHLTPAQRARYRSSKYQENRRGTESVLFGVPATARADRRPIYGHVRETGNVDSEGNAYGPVALDLWAGKNHITTTEGDSLDDLMDHRDAEHFGTKISAIPRDEAWNATGFEDLAGHQPAEGWTYREAQVHGGVPVDRAHIRRAQVMASEYSDAHKWSAQALRAKGIPTTVLKEHEQPSLFENEQLNERGEKKPYYQQPDYSRGENFWAGVPKDKE